MLFKIFTQKKIDPENFCGMMPKIWGQEHTTIHHVGFNLFLCKFKNARIKGLILESSSWFYDKRMLLLEEPKEDSCGEDMDFKFVSFWVHFHKLPYGCFSRSSAMEIGSLLGKVEQVDIDEEIDPSWGSSLRVKIQIDVHKSLKRGCKKNQGKRKEKKGFPSRTKSYQISATDVDA